MHLRPAGMGPGAPGLCEKAQGVGCAGAGAGAGGTGRRNRSIPANCWGDRSGFRCWRRDESRKGWRESNETPSVHAGRRAALWGWQTGFLVPSAVMAVLLEGARLVKVRWEFSEDDFTRFGRSARCCCWARLFTRSTPTWASRISPARASLRPRRRRSAPARAARGWRGVVPLAADAFLSVHRGLDVQPGRAGAEGDTAEDSALAVEDNGQASLPEFPTQGVNLGYPYFALTLFAASNHVGENSLYFFWGLTLLLGWRLVRSDRTGSRLTVGSGCSSWLSGSASPGRRVSASCRP